MKRRAKRQKDLKLNTRCLRSESRVCVGQIARIFRNVETEIGIGKDTLFDAPKLDAVSCRNQQLGRKAAFLFEHKVPGLRRFDDMRVGVDEPHNQSASGFRLVGGKTVTSLCG